VNTLSTIKPIPIHSVVERNRLGNIVGWLVAALILLPVFVYKLNHRWLWVVVTCIGAVGAEIGIRKLQDHLRAKAAKTPPQVFPPPLSESQVAALTALLPQLFVGSPVVALVLFSYGTFVVLVDLDFDFIEKAKELLSACGPTAAGTPSGDMLVFRLESGDFLIGGHHPNMLTFVSRSALADTLSADRLDVAAAYYGRDRRVFDAFSQSVVHVEKLAKSE